MQASYEVKNPKGDSKLEEKYLSYLEINRHADGKQGFNYRYIKKYADDTGVIHYELQYDKSKDTKESGTFSVTRKGMVDDLHQSTGFYYSMLTKSQEAEDFLKTQKLPKVFIICPSSDPNGSIIISAKEKGEENKNTFSHTTLAIKDDYSYSCVTQTTEKSYSSDNFINNYRKEEGYTAVPNFRMGRRRLSNELKGSPLPPRRPPESPTPIAFSLGNTGMGIGIQPATASSSTSSSPSLPQGRPESTGSPDLKLEN